MDKELSWFLFNWHVYSLNISERKIPSFKCRNINKEFPFIKVMWKYLNYEWCVLFMDAFYWHELNVVEINES